MQRLAQIFLAVFLILFRPADLCAQERFWRPVSDGRSDRADRWELDPVGLDSLLRSAGSAPFRLPLPAPGARIVPAGLQLDTLSWPRSLREKYPHIRLYNGHLTNQPEREVCLLWDGATLRFASLHTGESWVSEKIGARQYRARSSREVRGAATQFCRTPEPASREEGPPADPAWLPIGDTLFTYRIAVAATGEYTRFFDGKKDRALAAILSSLQRVNLVFERDLSVRFRLAEGSDTLIFSNPDTDPFEGDVLLGNTELFDRLLGADRYDIGHVFGTDGSGVALLGSACDEIRKAGGYSSRNPPEGDLFDFDLFAHELGHQLGARHTFNNCGFQGPVAYEPGSGSTIMSYAGLCGVNNLADRVDPYFHAASQAQISRFIREDRGGSCPEKQPTGNFSPVVSVGLDSLVLPYRTPFELSGRAADDPAQGLSWCWEQWDLGPRTGLDSVWGNAPLFRSFPPKAVPSRSFPRMASLLGIDSLPGELLPDYARDLQFRLTVRDRAPGGGGVGSDLAYFPVTDRAGPFRILSQQQAAVWEAGSEQWIQWEVAGTDRPPVNVATLTLLLSRDGGFTYPDTLAAGVPNTGAFLLRVPELADTLFGARIKLKAEGSVFFQINGAPITLLPASVTALEPPPEDGGLLEAVYPVPARDHLYIRWRAVPAGRVRIRMLDALGRVVFTTERWPAGKESRLELPGLPGGWYVLTVAHDGRTIRQRRTILVRPGQ